MNNIISEYQKWKQQGEDLRIKAKQAMEARFREYCRSDSGRRGVPLRLWRAAETVACRDFIPV